ncbi:MAG: GIY-YIG nuclease family protein [Rhodospirillales bacterium]|nr:GIY-YIG nuclease family protein [Rhodospirillales bacterium]
MSDEPGAYVYMLRCADSSYYVGSARLGLDQRVNEHNQGVYGDYTSTRRPVTLVWADHFLNITDAIAVERKIKGWSRAKKEALIRGDYDAIRDLAKRRT